MALSIEVITNLQKDKNKLSAAWNSFNKSSIPEAFIFEDMLNWWKQFGGINNNRVGHNKQCKILLVHSNGKLRAILPLMTVERYKFKVLKVTSIEFICQTFNSSSLDIIHNNLTQEEVYKIFSFLKKEFKHDFISLSYLDERSVLLKEFTNNAFLHAGKVIIPLDNDYETIRKEIYSKNLRHILNKFNRRIRESGNTIRHEIVIGKCNILNLKRSIIEISLSKLLNKGMHSIYENKELGDKYFDEMVNNEMPFCSVYYDNEKLVSYNMGYVKNNIIYALDAAYNRTYADGQKIGLGILAYDKIVEHYAGKYKLLDMGFGLDDYKFRFSKKVAFTKTLLLKGNTLKSHFIYKRVKSKLMTEEFNLKQVLDKYLLTS